jgi:hypothetical protein
MSKKKKVEHPILETIRQRTVPKVPGTRNISYSQFSTYLECPHQFYLKYGQGHYPFSSSIHSVFGTALHETIQEYINLLYNSTVKASNAFDYENFLRERMISTYQLEVQANGGKHFSTKDELQEFHEDGCKIMKYIKKSRTKLFDTKYEILLANELLLNTPVVEGNEHIRFTGFIDTIIFDTFSNKIKIFDWKTSTSGWSKWQISDEKKLAQLRLYKHYFSKQYGVPFEDITCEFKVLKRKVNTFEFEGYESETPRLATIRPSQAAITVKKSVMLLEEFVQDCFDQEGKVKEGYYTQTNTDHSCRFCPFNSNRDLCPR